MHGLLLTIARSSAQESACKDLGCNGQSPVITAKGTYTPVSKRAGSRSPLTRSPAQGSECKDLVAMVKERPSRPRTLTLRSLSTPAHAHHIKKPAIVGRFLSY
ncbi:alpha-galactosidase [Lacticaseibacillus rhamnosus]|nr:alpha-galactosidase [Lacticaseibacillus rhamnosus]